MEVLCIDVLIFFVHTVNVYLDIAQYMELVFTISFL
jgi:hypothetical protein